MLFRTFTFAVVVCLVSALSAQATMLTLSPNADTFVQANTSSTNYGTSSIINIKNDGGGTAHRKGYVRYDISSVPMSEVITAASLDLTFIESGAGSGLDGTNTFEVFGLNDGDAGENWLESGAGSINWDNAPANTAGGASITASASSLGTFNITGHTGSVNFAGTGGTAVKDFLAASVSDDLASFIVVRLTPAGGNYVHAFASKEAGGGSGALLNITSVFVPPVPEPSTGLLMGLASCVLLPQLRRRRNNQKTA